MALTKDRFERLITGSAPTVSPSDYRVLGRGDPGGADAGFLALLCGGGFVCDLTPRVCSTGARSAISAATTETIPNHTRLRPICSTS